MKILALSLLAALALSFTLIDNNEKTETHPAPVTKTAMDKDDYRVIKVNGRILYVRNGRDMNRGDIFSPREKLDFKTDDSRAAVISKSAGRKILSPKSGSGSKATLLPAMNNISSRSGGLLNMIDLQNHFDGRYLVMGTAKLQISDESFPMDKNQFFFMRYEYEGETINKKLNHEGDHLIIDKKDLFKIDDKPIDGSGIETMELYYRDGNKSILINDFQPIFPNTEELKAELEIILLELEGEKKDKKLDEITAYLNEYYGKPQKDNLNTWLDENMEWD